MPDSETQYACIAARPQPTEIVCLNAHRAHLSARPDSYTIFNSIYFHVLAVSLNAMGAEQDSRIAAEKV
ncbi:hypothetical protein EAS62_11555 [Bradyrhizobium zhanjiangense]|uniref:Uncharacterized protein n=1 Tax=Bradyrhizobium zhanjiangense TaxID=1325107 RepID=A0ABY0DMI7_9BRAD|nr:hypothetical protein EAS62_11555 [Bradyrhizobium zhanjiangense]